MKLILFALLVCLMGNTKPVNSDDVKTLEEMIEMMLQWLVGELHLDSDTGLDIYQLLDKYNYPLESHNVTTEDGYILTLHRIPHGRNTNIRQINKGFEENTTQPAILLVHGMFCSGVDWVWEGPNKAFALLSADMGYDVWLANTRGTGPSSKHQTLTPANAPFWDFSFHEKGYYDVPAIIDHILNTTGLDKITYVGHSQGTSDALVMTSTRPEYNDKLNLIVLFSPIAYMEHLGSPLLRVLIKFINLIKLAFDLLDIYGLPFTPTVNLALEAFCSNASEVQSFCLEIIGQIVGYDKDQLDLTRMSVFLTNYPNGDSLKELYHYEQEIKSGSFRQYDYGNDTANIMHYGTAEPPSYDIKKITAPIAAYYAKNDYLANVTDVERLLSELSTDLVEQYLIEYEYFNHLDFIGAKDVKTLLYDRVFNVIQQFNPLNVG